MRATTLLLCLVLANFPASRCSAQEPTTAQQYVDRGEKFLKEKKLDIAMMDFNEAIRLDRQLPSAYKFRGDCWHEMKNDDRAIQDYDEAIRLNPKYWRAFNNRGNAKLAKKEMDNAIKDYDEAIRIQPDFAMLYRNRGQAYLVKKETDAALKNFDEGLRLAPDDEFLREDRATALWERKEFAKCIDDYTALIKLDPRNGFRYYQRASAWEQLNESKKVIADCTEAVRLDPKLTGAYITRGHAYMSVQLRLQGVARENNVSLAALVDYLKSNESDEEARNRYFYEPLKARNDFEEAIRIDSKSAKAYGQRGLLNSLEGREDDAIRDFLESVRLDPTLPYSLAGLGHSYEKSGKYYQALAHFSDLAKLSPKSKEAKDGVERVRKLAREKWESTSVKLISIELDTELKKSIVKKTPPYSLAKNTSQQVEEVVKVQHSTSVTEGWKADAEVRGKLSAWILEVGGAVRAGIEKSTNRSYGVETERRRSVTIKGTGQGVGPRVVWVNLYRTGKATVEIGGERFDLPFEFWDDFILETESGEPSKK